MRWLARKSSRGNGVGKQSTFGGLEMEGCCWTTTYAGTQEYTGKTQRSWKQKIFWRKDNDFSFLVIKFFFWVEVSVAWKIEITPKREMRWLGKGSALEFNFATLIWRANGGTLFLIFYFLFLLKYSCFTMIYMYSSSESFPL